MTASFEAKEISLWGVTGLVVAYVRHGLEHQWQWWDSIEQFFVAWIIHTMGLALFVVVAGVSIERFYEFFLGNKREHTDYNENIFHGSDDHIG
jgi:hypothetical protein